MASTPLPGIGRISAGDVRVRREIASLVRLFGSGLITNSTTGQIDVNNSALSLAGLGDVSIPSPTNGQVLAFNTGAGKWEAVNAVTAVTGTAPIVSSGSTTPAISILVLAGGGIVGGATGLYLDTMHTVTAYGPGAGNPYTITTVFAQVTFAGGTNPTVTLDKAGTWAIKARVRVTRNNSTHIGLHNISLKLRRSNNTAADVTHALTKYADDPHSASNASEVAGTLPEVLYTTANTTDIIQLWALLDVAASSGSHQVTEADIEAYFLH